MTHFHTEKRRRRDHNNMVAYPFADSSVTHTTLHRVGVAVRSKPTPTLGDVLPALLKKVVLKRAVEVYGMAATKPAKAAIERLAEQMAQKALSDWEGTLCLFYDGQGVEDFLTDVQAWDLHHV